MILRRALVVLPAVAFLAVLGVGLFRARPDAALGGPAPAFSLPDLADRERQTTLASLRGRPVVLNFWASWCGPCRDEAPELVTAHAARSDRVTFLGVNILDGREEALAFANELEIPYPSVRDADGRVSKSYGVTGVPETVFIDAEGRLVGVFIGAFVPGQLEGLLEQLLSLAPGDTMRISGRGETRAVP